MFHLNFIIYLIIFFLFANYILKKNRYQRIGIVIYIKKEYVLYKIW